MISISCPIYYFGQWPPLFWFKSCGSNQGAQCFFPIRFRANVACIHPLGFQSNNNLFPTLAQPFVFDFWPSPGSRTPIQKGYVHHWDAQLVTSRLTTLLVCDVYVILTSRCTECRFFESHHIITSLPSQIASVPLHAAEPLVRSMADSKLARTDVGDCVQCVMTSG